MPSSGASPVKSYSLNSSIVEASKICSSIIHFHFDIIIYFI
nr:MAG TPA: hypothetical protein [Crassvirales sp.]